MNTPGKSLEEHARNLPVPELPEEVWNRVESGIASSERKPKSGGPAPWFRYAIAATFVIAALAAAWVMLQDFNHPETASTQPSPLIKSANDDLDMAIMYYERAIGKLRKAADEHESSVNPEILALYTEKISLLQQSIAECKQALKINRNNPVVRTQLFASYADLQSTYESLSQSEHAQKFGN